MKKVLITDEFRDSFDNIIFFSGKSYDIISSQVSFVRVKGEDNTIWSLEVEDPNVHLLDTDDYEIY